MRLKHWNTETDGMLTEAAFCEKMQALGYEVSRYVYPPGTYFPDHTHELDKIDAVLSGRFKMTVEGETVILESGDYLFVPKATVHSAEVIGNVPVVSLDAVKVR
ncbi:MAG: cupin domain-containing protein [Gammaproteobacteria bacterium]|nr:cupin domain-containing protein [Gammaproteobacteria bacterium]MCI0590378.1 cupin domain-containing protein [Gammaproteobacteria bacterium]